MSDQLPTITAHDGRRRLACLPIALVSVIVNADERILMLSHPNSAGRWETINGAMEHGESVLAGCLREIHEEAGDQLQVCPLHLLHIYTFPYDETIPHMLSLCYLFAYEGGDVIPGDDMAGSQVRWVSVGEIERGEVQVAVPRDVPWLFARAVELYRTLHDQPPVLHQPQFDVIPQRKYDKKYTNECRRDESDEFSVG
ncbi:MAG: NUDIX hydrolase [Anaerolineae bacterium]|nr:NUDIX hydrolase [Anaerolineae bacterium]